MGVAPSDGSDDDDVVGDKVDKKPATVLESGTEGPQKVRSPWILMMFQLIKKRGLPGFVCSGAGQILQNIGSFSW